MNAAEINQIRAQKGLTAIPESSVGVRIIQQPIPSDQWPIWAKALAKFATPDDKGIGDVVARMIGDENSSAFKRWFKVTFGKDCGCTGRQREWNLKYPLGSEQ